MKDLPLKIFYLGAGGWFVFLTWGLVQVFPQTNPTPAITVLWSQVQTELKKQGVEIPQIQQPSQPNSQPSESPNANSNDSSNNPLPNNPPPQPTQNGQPIVNQEKLTTQKQSLEKSNPPSAARQRMPYSP